jgi:hypothetical protein
MSKLLIYIGENQRFDLESCVHAITTIDGVSNARRGEFIGAVFECNYTFAGRITVVRLSEDLETISVEGLGEDAAEFAMRFQQKLPLSLHAMDIDYSFNLTLSNFKNGADLSAAILAE